MLRATVVGQGRHDLGVRGVATMVAMLPEPLGVALFGQDAAHALESGLAVMSVTTTWSMTFISVRAFCMRRMRVEVSWTKVFRWRR